MFAFELSRMICVGSLLVVLSGLLFLVICGILAMIHCHKPLTECGPKKRKTIAVYDHANGDR